MRTMCEIRTNKDEARQEAMEKAREINVKADEESSIEKVRFTTHGLTVLINRKYLLRRS